jgi:signal transduction histidine kinase
VLAVGGLGCVWGGLAADRRGRAWLVRRALAVSGACALLVGFTFAGPVRLTAAVALVWGASVIADSAQFSVLVTESVPPHAVGTALTLQTSMGFLLTAGSIQLVPPLAAALGWRWAFPVLALGPAVGLWCVARLARAPAPTSPPPARPRPAMTRPPAPRPRRPAARRSVLRGRRAPAFVLVASLLLAAVATAIAARVNRARAEGLFDNAVQSATDRIESRVQAYEALLYGAAGLFAADADTRVTAAQFRAYVGRREMDRYYPGVRGVGYSAVLWRAGGAPFDSAAALAGARAMGSPAPRLWPSLTERPRDEVHAIVYLEPDDAPNRTALGYDMHADATRRDAMERARDSGDAAATSAVRLVQDTTLGTAQPGFLLYAPVYRGGTVPATEAGRRAAVVGYVYAAFRAGDLLRGIFGSEREPRVDFRIYDGPDTATAARLADSRAAGGLTAPPPALGPARAVKLLDVAGQRWAIVFSPLGRAPGVGTDLGAGDLATVGVAMLGLLVSAALTLVTAAEVRARERVERNDALRARFFAAMSHELRTPVNAVLGYNDLLLAGVYGDLSDDQRLGIDRSQRAARHLLELVNDVLDLSKLEAGKVDVAIEVVALGPLLEDLGVTIGPLAAERGCTLSLDASRCEATLHSDPRRLRQILLNLLSNATKFGAGHPVRVWCDHPPAVGGAPGVAIHVRDEGPGIAPADQARVFEEFVQLPTDPAVGVPGGTGLGLPISRRLADLLGGTLTVSSALGAGSTFTLWLPLGPPAYAKG